MAASTITAGTWVDDTGTPASPNEDGTIINVANITSKIYAPINQMFAGAGAYATFTLGGKLAVEGTGVMGTFSSSVTGPNVLLVQNTSPGTTNLAGVRLGNDTSTTAGLLYTTSTTYTAAADTPQDGVLLRATYAGGLSLSASAGPVGIYTAGVLRASITNAGNVILANKPAVFGAAAIANVDMLWDFRGTHTGTTNVIGLYLNPVITVPANGLGYVARFDGALVEAGSGTHSLLVGLSVTAPTVTPGAAAVTETATLRITGAMSAGTTNYAFLVDAGTSRFDGDVLIGDTTSSADVTLGLVLNQGANDDGILSLKSSDVAHGMTTIAELDTYGSFQKFSATGGGLQIRGFEDGVLSTGLACQACTTTFDNTKTTTGSEASILLNASLRSGTGLTAHAAGTNLVAIANHGTLTAIFDPSGLWINQGGNDTSILRLASSDVAHGMGTVENGDVYGAFSKKSATAGALLIRGFEDSGTIQALELQGCNTTADTAKTTAAYGAVLITGSLKTGTDIGGMGADANLMAIANHGTTRFIFDAEGSGHADVEWVAFDDHNDVALLSSLNTLAPSLSDAFGQYLTYQREDLLRLGIVDQFHEEHGRPHAMVNWTRLAMLHTGALVQMGRELAAVKAELKRLTA